MGSGIRVTHTASQGSFLGKDESRKITQTMRADTASGAPDYVAITNRNDDELFRINFNRGQFRNNEDIKVTKKEVQAQIDSALQRTGRNISEDEARARAREVKAVDTIINTAKGRMNRVEAGAQSAHDKAFRDAREQGKTMAQARKEARAARDTIFAEAFQRVADSKFPGTTNIINKSGNVVKPRTTKRQRQAQK